MDQISMDDVMELWKSMPEKSWSGIKTAMENMGGKASSDEMMQMADKMENSGEPFPQNPDELYSMFEQNMG